MYKIKVHKYEMYNIYSIANMNFFYSVIKNVNNTAKIAHNYVRMIELYSW